MYFDKQVTSIKQIIEIDKHILVLIEDTNKGNTEFYLLNTEIKKRVYSMGEINLEVVKGSTLDTVIIINHSKKLLSIFSLENLVLERDKRVELNLEYEINFPHYLKQTEKVLFLNENNMLMTYSLNGEETEARFFDLSFFSMNTGSSMNMFSQLSVSKLGEAMVLLTDKNILFFEFSTNSRIILNSKNRKVSHIHLLRHQRDYYLLKVKKYKMNAVIITKVNANLEASYKNLLGNSILDVLHHSIHSNNDPSRIKCKELLCFAKGTETLDLIEKYFLTLTAVNKYIRLGGIISNFQWLIRDLPYDIKTFLISLGFVLPSRIFLLYPFAPLSNCEDNLLKIKGLAPNPSIIEHFSNYFSFGILEEALKNFENICVAAIIGPNHINNITLANHLYNANCSFYTKDSVNISLAEFKGKNHLIILYDYYTDNLSNDCLKTIEFISAIADNIILNIPFEQVSSLKIYLSKLLYCKNRIEDAFLYKYSLNIAFFSVPPSYKFSLSAFDFIPSSLKFSHSAFSNPNSLLFDSEINLVRHIFLKQTGRWDGKSLSLSIRLIIAQLYVEDNHSLEY